MPFYIAKTLTIRQRRSILLRNTVRTEYESPSLSQDTRRFFQQQQRLVQFYARMFGIDQAPAGEVEPMTARAAERAWLGAVLTIYDGLRPRKPDWFDELRSDFYTGAARGRLRVLTAPSAGAAAEPAPAVDLWVTPTARVAPPPDYNPDRR